MKDQDFKLFVVFVGIIVVILLCTYVTVSSFDTRLNKIEQILKGQTK